MVHLTTSSEAPGPLSLLLSVSGEVPLVQNFQISNKKKNAAVLIVPTNRLIY